MIVAVTQKRIGLFMIRSIFSQSNDYSKLSPLNKVFARILRWQGAVGWGRSWK